MNVVPYHQITVSPPNLPRRLVRTVAAAFTTELPLITLTTTGAKGRQPRSVPLLGIPTGKDLIIVASNWGQACRLIPVILLAPQEPV